MRDRNYLKLVEHSASMSQSASLRDRNYLKLVKQSASMRDRNYLKLMRLSASMRDKNYLKLVRQSARMRDRNKLILVYNNNIGRFWIDCLQSIQRSRVYIHQNFFPFVVHVIITDQ